MTVAKRDASTAVPRLRFPEFRQAAAWVESPLKDICTVNPGNDGLPDSFVYIDLESVEGGVLKSKSRIEKKSAPSRAQRLLRNGDVIFQVVRPYQRNNLFVEFHDDDAYVASTGYAQLRSKNSEAFLYQLIHTDPFVEKVVAKCSGSNYPAINSADLADVVVFAPEDVAEQQKIADCLTSLDELIAAQGRKVEALKAHKRGLMQQLFPREGETVPRLRFPEFREKGEWNATRLCELAEYENGKAYEQDIQDDGRYVVVNSRFISTDGAIRKRSSANYCIAAAGDVLMVLSDLPSGRALAKCFYVDTNDEYAVNQRVARLTPINVHSKFLYYRLNRHASLLAYDDGLTQTHLSKGSVTECELIVPADWSEQQYIADCLSSLDAQITAESNQLAALKTHKQGLMQQLFPSPEAG